MVLGLSQRCRTLEGATSEYDAQVVEKSLALTLGAAKGFAQSQRQGADHVRIAQAWLVQEQCTGTGYATDRGLLAGRDGVQ